MHILLTDHLTCPRCGPNFGLIVLADRLEDRRVVEGRLGCANCRESYVIAGGVADLRAPGAPGIGVVPGPAPDAERAFRTAALLGVQAASSRLLVVERAGEVAAAVAGILPEVHVLGWSVEKPAAAAGRGLISRFRSGGRIPLRDGSVHGVAALGVQVEPVLAEIRRVLVPGGRLVVDPAPPEMVETLALSGFTVLLEQEGVAVAAVSGPR